MASSFEKVFKGHPSDPIEFIYRENWVTLSSIGSIITFSLVGAFREQIFDKIMAYVLPHEGFDFMKLELPDVGHRTNNTLGVDPKDSRTIRFGGFIREAIIWIFMILLLYIMALFVRWPAFGGFSFNTTAAIASVT